MRKAREIWKEENTDQDVPPDEQLVDGGYYETAKAVMLSELRTYVPKVPYRNLKPKKYKLTLALPPLPPLPELP